MKFSVVCISLVAALLVACGGGGGGGTSTPPAMPVAIVFAGLLQGAGSRDGTGVAAQFRQPGGAAQDSGGTIFVADTGNHTIRRVTPQGVVTTFAGTAGSQGTTDGTGSTARFFVPEGLAADGAGNLYVADTYGHTVRKVTSGATVTTLAGSSTSGFADGMGSAAQFGYLGGVTVDGAGTIYVTDTDSGTIRRVTSAGAVTTLAGTGGLIGSADGTGAVARFNYAYGITADGAGDVYVADSGNSTIRKVTAAGVVTTFAGSSPSGSNDGPGETAGFNLPYGIAIDGSGTAYVADTYNHTIRKITAAGEVTTFAGSAGNPGASDGAGSAARFYYPGGLALDGLGNLYVSDGGNCTIRRITAGGVVTTVAGLAGASGSIDGTGSTARFASPIGLAMDPSGNVYVADADNATIRLVTPGGVVTTFAGTAGSYGPADGTGAAAQFRLPIGLATDAAGNIYVADYFNHAVRKITPAAVVTTLPGGIYGPHGVAVDNAGSVYVTDATYHTILKISTAGVITTLAGVSGSAAQVDGTGSDARFNTPWGMAADGAGNVYLADTYNYSIRKGVPLIAGDFSHDLKPDILWQNTTSGDRGFWLMSGTTFTSWVDVGVITPDWRIAATADFNADGQTDILWENTTTGDRGFWLMNGTTFGSWLDIGVISTQLRIVTAADFNGDGKPDLLWENTVTGKRVIWFMNGTTFSSSYNLGIVDPSWHIVAAADLNADAKPDIVWENSTTGERYVWFMNGTAFVSGFSIGVVATDWHIAAVADYDGDGQPDILWENTTDGDRGFWLMSGTTFSSWVDIGLVTTDWQIAP